MSKKPKREKPSQRELDAYTDGALSEIQYLLVNNFPVRAFVAVNRLREFLEKNR
jgi:hypothetical protein